MRSHRNDHFPVLSLLSIFSFGDRFSRLRPSFVSFVNAKLLTLFNASLGLTLGLTANPVQAAFFNFIVSIDSGSLDGQTFFGSFNFDDSGLTEVGTEFLSVSQLTFNFFNTTFTEADDLFGGSEVTFLDGEFLGLSFSAENSQVSFSFNPGFFQASEASFAYKIISSNGQGFGDVTFEQVPEPAPLLGLLIVGVLGLVVVAKRLTT